MLRPSKLTNHAKVLILAFLSGLPALAFTVYIAIRDDYSTLTLYSMGILVLGVYIACLATMYRLVVRPLQTMANIVSALKEKDYTLRVKYTNTDDPMGLSFSELNDLADKLQNQRLDMIETHQLLFKILEEVEAAVLCFDNDDQLVMANRYAQELYGSNTDSLLGQRASELGLKNVLASTLQTTQEIEFPSRKSRWLVKHSPYRDDGRPHMMLLIADLQGPLREEELDAWKKLIRVLGHELNNSMTPLKSMANSLERMLAKPSLPDDWKEDMEDGLSVIGRRVDSLSRFVNGYSQLARTPRPQKSPLNITRFMERVIRFEPSFNIDLQPGPDINILGDEGQLYQVIINLLKNAVEASASTNGKVSATWRTNDESIYIRIIDEGQGLANEDNLFVPFFSTKRSGSGIGLALSRQIVEAHKGRIALENRIERNGCIATVTLPIKDEEAVGEIAPEVESS